MGANSCHRTWIQTQFANTIARIDPVTGKVEEYEIPYTIPASTNPSILPNSLGNTVLSCAIRPGRDGNVYAGNGLRNQLVRINTTTRHIDVFTPPDYNPLGDLQPFNDLYSSKDGIYFTQTTANKFSFFSFATEKIVSYKIPTLTALPLGIFVASDGNVYFAEFGAFKIGRFNPTTKKIDEFPIPLSLAGPAVIRAETEGRYIWFTAFIGNGLGRLDMQTGNVVAYTYPSPLALTAEDTVDSNGNIWFSTATQNTLNYLTPSTGKFTSITQPSTLVVAPISLPFYFEIASNYGPGNAIWFTQQLANRVGRYSLD